MESGTKGQSGGASSRPKLTRSVPNEALWPRRNSGDRVGLLILRDGSLVLWMFGGAL
jgi:hypothetical protein